MCLHLISLLGLDIVVKYRVPERDVNWFTVMWYPTSSAPRDHSTATALSGYPMCVPPVAAGSVSLIDPMGWRVKPEQACGETLVNGGMILMKMYHLWYPSSTILNFWFHHRSLHERLLRWCTDLEDVKNNYSCLKVSSIKILCFFLMECKQPSLDIFILV